MRRDPIALNDFVTNLFDDRQEPAVKKLQPLHDEINGIADRLQWLSEEELKAQTAPIELDGLHVQGIAREDGHS